MTGWLSPRWLRRASGFGLGLVFVAAVGCGPGHYPTSLTYPVRTDLLVTKAPTEQPAFPDAPGDLDRFIAKTDSKQGQTLDPGKLKDKDRGELNKALSGVFGTPFKPKVAVEDDEATQAALEELKLDNKTLARGSELYRRHCLHCHGLTGDGRGASGAWLNPHPRDYRPGKFKFMSSEGGDGRKPRRADLYRTLFTGIESTSMPAFNLLPEAELDAIVSYVIHLSIRGQVEFYTIQTLLNNDSLEEDTIAGHVGVWSKNFLVNSWASSDKKIIKPSTTPTYTSEQLQTSIVNGYKLFTDPQGAASCIACHVDFGRQVPFRFDDWGTLVRPANLTVNVYRGGRRPIDLYWRIKGGINPSGMPAAGSLADPQVWDVVNFLQALPYPRMLPEEVRDKIYIQDPKPTKVAAH